MHVVDVIDGTARRSQMFHRDETRQPARRRRELLVQFGSAALFSLSHGANDAQNTMGIIIGLFVSFTALFAGEAGFLRHLYLLDGETAGAFAILLVTNNGIAVGTTHTITGAIMGVGATSRLSAVRWGIAGRIVWARIMTIPGDLGTVPDRSAAADRGPGGCPGPSMSQLCNELCTGRGRAWPGGARRASIR